MSDDVLTLIGYLVMAALCMVVLRLTMTKTPKRNVIPIRKDDER